MKCTLFPRTRSLASGFASALCLGPHSSSAAKGVAAGKTTFFEIYSCYPHLHGRQQTNAVFWGQLQSRYLLISLIMSRLPYTRLHNKLRHKAALVGMFIRCLKAYFCPVFMFLSKQVSLVTSRNPMTTTSAELTNASAALVSVSLRRRPSAREGHKQSAQPFKKLKRC